MEKVDYFITTAPVKVRQKAVGFPNEKKVVCQDGLSHSNQHR
jgi:hypothetical protein